MIVVTAVAVIVAIVMSVVNHNEARKIREEHIDKFLERREQRRNNRRGAV